MHTYMLKASTIYTQLKPSIHNSMLLYILRPNILHAFACKLLNARINSITSDGESEAQGTVLT